MIKNIPFTTRARTIDHLGREQIADCPTAISEIWKNAYDAYARNVELHIFDGDEPVAAVYDDGHGMNYDEFINKWLVIGTETKLQKDSSPKEDRLGLDVRPRQGQKGIGRLSAANLGPLLLVVSKRCDDDFIAALIDWRIFENPFLNLNDIEVPVTQFQQKDQLIETLPTIYAQLLGNIDGGGDDKKRTERVKFAWESADQLSEENAKESFDERLPSQKIRASIKTAPFNQRHFDQWMIWNNDASSGTALFISNINDDLKAHLANSVPNSALDNAKKNFFESLSGFVDPITDHHTPEMNAKPINFNYAVKVWDKQNSRSIIKVDKEYNRSKVSNMEHVLEGSVDENGVFRGQVKAFGHWQETGIDYQIPPPNDLRIPTRFDSFLGPIDLFISSFEQVRSNTTHSDDEFLHFNDLAEKYSGFMVYRNGLRVLPFGREDNDFFKIETRRSLNAGTEFWNARRMFGRIAVSTENNPNLKDKAGREGFIDNMAAKTLREIITNILKTSARDFFGRESDHRIPNLKKSKKRYEQEKAEEEHRKLQNKLRSQFKSKLIKNRVPLASLFSKIETLCAKASLDNEREVEEAKVKIENYYQNLSELRLPNTPAKLGSLEGKYRDFQSQMTQSSSSLRILEKKVSESLEAFQDTKAERFLEKQIHRLKAKHLSHIKNWEERIDALQKDEHKRLKSLLKERDKTLFRQLDSIMTDYNIGKNTFAEASAKLDDAYNYFSNDNEELFIGYHDALENLSESIDIQTVAQYGGALQTEVDRLNGLAQIGIAVEILGHELQSFDDMVSFGLKGLPEDIQNSTAAESIRTGYEGLTNQLRFLSPLKVSGTPIQEQISGLKIVEHIETFFAEIFASNKITLEPTEAFLQFSVYEQPARILPVFINLINNSVYWLNASKQRSKTILLSVQDEFVVVSDNGSGIETIDEDSLFTLFFTRKSSGGRGVGLYLCKANLRAGGHTIEYWGTTTNTKPLEGANFAIRFAGGKFSDDI